MCLKVQKAVFRELKDFNHSSELSLSNSLCVWCAQDRILPYPQKYPGSEIPAKDRGRTCFPNMPNTVLPVRHSEAQGKRTGFKRKAN